MISESPECPIQECRHMRDVKSTLNRLENLIYFAIGLGILNLGGTFF